jgi:hypothetical protein
MDKRARVSLIAVLSVGILAAIAGIIRQIRIGPLDEYDAYSIWNFLELHLGIIAASLPALKPLLKKLSGATLRGASTSIPMAVYGHEAGAEGGWRRQGSSEISILDPGKGIHVTTGVEVR